MEEGESLKNDISIELFAQQVGLFIDRNNIEEALKISEVKYRSLVNLMQVGIIIQDSQAKILFSNPKALEYLGISEDQLLGRTSFDPDWNVIHEDGSPFPGNTHPVPQAIATRLPVRNVIMGVYRPALKDRIWLLVDAEPQLDIDGNVIQVVCSFIDITERIIAEDVSRQLNEVQVFLAQHSGKKDELNFFELLAQYLAKSMEADFVCIDKLEGDGLNARTIAVWHDGQFEDNIVYSLKDTPCGDVVGKAICCFPASVCKLFPNDTVLQDLKAESYVGVTLWSHTGKPIGLIAVIKSNPIKNLKLAEDLLKMVAVRASGELERMETELVLKASEEKYRLLLENSGIGVGVYSLEGKILLFNQKALENLGGKVEDYIGKNLKEVFGEPTASVYLSRFEEVVNSEISLEYEDFVSLPTGNKWFLSNHSKIENAEGEIIGIQVLAHDITERKQAENELRASETRFRNLLQDVETVSVQGYAPDGTTQYWNKASEKLYGYSAEEAIGKNLVDLIIPPDMRENISRAIIEMARTGVPVPASELSLMRKDGSQVSVFSSHTIVQIPDKLQELFCIDIDLSELKKAEIAIQKRETQINQLLQTTDQGIYGIDMNGCCTFINKSGLNALGYKLEECLGKNMHDLIHHHHIDNTIYKVEECPIFKAKETGKGNKVNNEVFWKKDGTSFFIEYSSFPIIENGEIQGSVITFSDITERKQIEEKLRESEERFREMSDLLPQIVFETDEMGNLTYVNKQAYSILRYPTDFNVRGINTISLYIPEDQSRAIENIKKRLIVDTEENNEYTMIRYDGSLMNVLVYSNPIIKNNKTAGLRGIIIDISNLKQAELKLHETNAYLENLLNYANAPIIVWNQQFKIMRFNHAFEHLTGFVEKEVYGKSLEILFPVELVEKSMDLIKKTSSGERWDSVEIEIQHIDKSIRTVLWNSATIFDNENNNPIATIAQGHDITERKMAEEALRENEKKYRFLTENTADVIWVINIATGKFIYISPSVFQLRGFTAEEAMHETMEDSLTPESIVIVNDAISKNIQTFIAQPDLPNHYINEIQQYCKNGEIIWVEVSTQFRYSPSGDIEVVGVSRNIEERKKAEAKILESEIELRKSNATKDKFFSIIAHDLKSPFNSIIGFSEVLIEKLIQNDYQQIRKYADVINQSSHRAMNLLMNLMEWAQSQTGRIEFMPESFIINDLIEENVNLFEVIAGQKSINIKTELFVNYNITADKAMINTVLRNLISNAVKFTKQGGEIIISATMNQNKVIVSVKDNGVGIPAESIERLFRIDESYSTYGTNKESGTGLGLILCREFIEKHSEKIWVESQLGIGSCFYFTLSLNSDYEEKIIEKNVLSIEKTKVQPKGLKILIAEDDEISEILLKTIISEICSEILISKTGKKAVEICRNNPDIDLILMDVKMPDLNGYDACRQIRQFNTNVIIIAQTAFGLANDREKALEAGCDDYISKPIKKKLLLEMIDKYFNK